MIEGRGNYWSDYRGYDADGDGAGDTPYRPRPPFAGQLDSEEALRFAYRIGAGWNRHRSKRSVVAAGRRRCRR